MRSLLRFIGSILYPVCMAIISPLLLFLLLLQGSVLLSRHLRVRARTISFRPSIFRPTFFQWPAKKFFLLRYKAIRWH